MYMDITSIDLFDQNVGMVCAKVTLTFSWISPGIDLFDLNVGMVCAKIRLRCSWISLLLIYLI